LCGEIAFNKILAIWSVFYPNKSIDTTYVVLVSGNNYITVICFVSGDLGTAMIDNKTSDKKSTKALSVPALSDPKKLSALTVSFLDTGLSNHP
jgi:hypothetical protein